MDHKYTGENLVSELMLHGRFNSMEAATHEQTYIPVDHKYTAEYLVSEFMLNGRFNPLNSNGISHSYQLDKSISVLEVAAWVDPEGGGGSGPFPEISHKYRVSQQY